jgi:dihydropteroate synthase
MLPVGNNKPARTSRCAIMGILNATPDSFSDGGSHKGVDASVEHALKMEEEGADIIDVGGESTRPGAEEVTAAEELRRVLPIITALRARSGIVLSIDTRKAIVAEAALDAGADIINDVSALRHDPRMAALAAERQIPVVLMHMQGDPASMQNAPRYVDVIAELLDFFHERLEFCAIHGITHPVIDPGIGFGKRLEHNLRILRELDRLSEFEAPILVGSSRKSFIGQITGLPVEQRLAGSIASSVMAYLHGANILRVHDVRETRSAIDIAMAIEAKEVSSHVV